MMETLQRFIEQSPAAMALFDRQMRYLAVSDRWRTDFNLGSVDLIGRSHYEVFPDLPERWKKTHQAAISGAILSVSEDRYDRTDGTVLWSRWQVYPWHATDGTIGGLVMFSEDITALKVAEEQLRERERQLSFMLKLNDSIRNLNDEFDIGMAAMRQVRSFFNCRTADFNYIEDNGFLHSGQIESSDEGGLQFNEVNRSFFSEQQLEAYRVGLHFVVTNPEASGVWTATQRTYNYHSLQTYIGIPVVKAGQLRAVMALGDDKPRDWSIDDIATLKNVAERIWSEAARSISETASRESEERLILALAAGHMGIFYWHSNNGHAYWSDEYFRLLGYKPGEVAPGFAAWMARIVPEDRSRLAEIIKSAQPEYTTEFRVMGHNGAVHWLEAYGRCELDQAGEPCRPCLSP